MAGSDEQQAVRRSLVNDAGTTKLTTPSDREIVLTRVFNAPRRLVFDAFAKPELVKRWLLGPPGWSMPVCEIDPRPGGGFRYGWRRDSDGKEMRMHGSYREVVQPERIVHAESFDEPWYPGEAVVTTTFVEQAGQTTVTITIQYDSKQTRDSVLKSGMERGVAQSYDRLAEILAAAA